MSSNRVRTALIAALVGVGAAGGGGYWWYHTQPRVPENITYGNGRLEAEEVHAATKIAGRVATVLVDEGDWVSAGQVIARMDTAELEAARKKADAERARAEETRAENQALIAQRLAELQYSEAELRRATILSRQGNIAKDASEPRQSERDVAQAALNAAIARLI